MLVIDTADKDATDASQTYVVGMSESAVGLVRGGELPSVSSAVCGRVLFCCRPPFRGPAAAPLGASGSQMVQV